MNQQYFDFGKNVFGPFLYGFIKWLRKSIESHSPEKIFFFSRDGYMMQNAYEQIEQYYSLGIPTEYVYFSRNSLRRALLWRCESYESSLCFLSKCRYIAFSEIMSYYGLSEGQVADFMKKFGIDLGTNFCFDDLSSNSIIKEIYTKNKIEIDLTSKKQFDNVIAYCKQIGMQGSCAIVDIGWHGSMQYYLEKLLQIASIPCRVHGFYVGHNSIVSLKGKANGWMYNSERLAYRKTLLCFFGVVEKFFQSSEGSTDSYCMDSNGIVYPTLKNYEYEEDPILQSYIVEMQSGAIEYIKDQIKYGMPDISEEDLYTPLLEFGKNPTLEQVHLFRFFYTTDGERHYFIPQKSLFRYKPKEFILALSNSMWKTGFMKAAFKIPFPYFWIYKLIRK